MALRTFRGSAVDDGEGVVGDSMGDDMGDDMGDICCGAPCGVTGRCCDLGEDCALPDSESAPTPGMLDEVMDEVTDEVSEPRRCRGAGRTDFRRMDLGCCG